MKIWVGFGPLRDDCVSGSIVVKSSQTLTEFVTSSRANGGFWAGGQFWNWAHVVTCHEENGEELRATEGGLS